MADYSKTHALLYVRQLNLNALGDTGIYVPFGRFQVNSMKLSNVSTTLAGSSGTLGLFSAPSAGGTTIVTAATGVITPLTAASVVNSASIASTALTAGTLGTGTNAGQNFIYLNVGIVHGAAATCDVLIEVTRWVGP